MNELKISKGEHATITIAHDKQRIEEGNFGKKYSWLVTHAGEDKKFTVTETLHNKLSKFKKGDSLRVELKPLDGGRQFWDVKLAENSQLPEPTKKADVCIRPEEKPVQKTVDWDAKDASIRLQCAVKVAVQSMTNEEKDMKLFHNTLYKKTEIILGLIEGGMRKWIEANRAMLNVESGSGE